MAQDLFGDFPSPSAAAWDEMLRPLDAPAPERYPIAPFAGAHLLAFYQRGEVQPVEPIRPRTKLSHLIAAGVSSAVTESIRLSDFSVEESVERALVAARDGATDLFLAVDSPDDWVAVQRITEATAEGNVALHIEAAIPFPGPLTTRMLSVGVRVPDAASDVDNHLGVSLRSALSAGPGPPTDADVDRRVFAGLYPSRQLFNADDDLAMQVAVALSTASETRRLIGDELRGTAAPLHVRLPMSTHFFLEVAKLRAFRIAFEGIQARDGVEADGHEVLVSGVVLSLPADYKGVDALIPLASMATAARIGQADYFLIDADLLDPVFSDVERRELLRHMQLVLREETGLDWVSDPAAGAYYIESATAQLVERGLRLHDRIEVSGGILRCLRNDTLGTLAAEPGPEMSRS